MWSSVLTDFESKDKVGAFDFFYNINFFFRIIVQRETPIAISRHRFTIEDESEICNLIYFKILIFRSIYYISMTYVNPTKLRVHPQTLINAAKTGYQIYQTGKKLYDTYQASRPKPVYSGPTKLSSYKPRGKRVSYKKKTYRRKLATKAKKTNRLVGRSIAKPIYTKRRSTMRRYNKGKLSLQTRLQNGMSLPNTTFARMYWRGNNSAVTTCGNPIYSGTTPIHLNDVTMCLNDISTSPSLSMLHPVTYSAMWKQLYNKWLVLGAKMTCRIQPQIMQTSIPSVNQTSAQQYRNILPLGNIRAGFWYVRCYYERAHTAGNDPTTVGHPIDDVPRVPSSNPNVDNKCELNWSTMREFLSDPTVTWKRDKSVLRQKLHVHSPQPINPSGNPGVIPAENNTISTEIEQNTSPIYLNVNFSAKKHFEEKNPLRNLPFMSWDQNLAEDYRFMIRIGYIAFGNDNTLAFHVPISRNPRFNAEYDIKYFVALREPKINPHDEEFSASAAKLADNSDLQDLDLDDDELDQIDELADLDDNVEEKD